MKSEFILPKKDPSFNIRNFLESAYKSNDPLKSLENIEVTKDMLNLLIPSDIDMTSKYPSYLYEDLFNYLSLKDQEWSDVSIHCKFIYFATSMVHIFKNSSVCYSGPNVKVPYACINVTTEGKMIVFRHSDIKNNLFRITLQIVRKPNDIEMIKKCINLQTLDEMSFSSGNAVHLCLRLDGELPFVSFVKPNAAYDFVTIIYFNNEFSGAYYKEKHKLICVKH